MTVHQIREATVQVSSEKHGTFTFSTSTYQGLVEAYFGSVNQNRRVLAALITAAAEINYFDADEMTLLAVAAEWNWYPSVITDGLAFTQDDFVADVWNRFAESD